MINTILLDMDGTLLPVDNETFTHTYFKLLCAKLMPYGYQPADIVRGLRSGMVAMVKNDGTRTNREAFWDDFANTLGEDVRNMEPICDEFYGNEFNKAKDILGLNVDRRPLIELLRSKGYRVVLANNPMLPPPGTNSRLSWLSLNAADFDLVTDYSNSTYCKPNPDYYREIVRKVGAQPEECLMVGNSLTDDATAAQAGCDVYIVTDALEGDVNELNKYKHGTFAEFCKLVEELPKVN